MESALSSIARRPKGRRNDHELALQWRASTLTAAAGGAHGLALVAHLLHQCALPLVPVVELVAHRAEHGLHAPIAAGELGRLVGRQDLLLLRVVVVRDVDLQEVPVHVVQPLDLVLHRRAHHQLRAELPPADGVRRDELREGGLERIRAAVRLAIGEHEEQHRALRHRPGGHALQGLRERRGAVGRRLERLDEVRVGGAFDAHRRLPVQEVHVDPGVVEAGGDVDDVRDRGLQLLPARCIADTDPAQCRRHARILHAPGVVGDDDDFVVLQDGEVVRLHNGDLEPLEDLSNLSTATPVLFGFPTCGSDVTRVGSAALELSCVDIARKSTGARCRGEPGGERRKPKLTRCAKMA
eukprot:CAMPEP_0176273412 /NCGR_PEP_ID=MMETSP0121_2-20121125/46207_1 /TAXON_ID=160619 /ORGANISM="Kryptoperidinium foliaceum, Strain CCMP 1326" /LENGTH=352 /DNA_ID=CAMNT_0017613597 /DNA_START=282 /DNA_END=1338 /DNA_ORIENTATION=-